MAYTDVEAVRRIIGRKLPSGFPEEDILSHIERAEAHVNGVLQGAFKVPFAPTPKLIKVVTTDLAVFYLAESLFSSNLPNLDEYQKTRYERAVAMLSDIVNGTLALEVDGIIIKPVGYSGFATTNEQIIFTYDEPEW